MRNLYRGLFLWVGEGSAFACPPGKMVLDRLRRAYRPLGSGMPLDACLGDEEVISLKPGDRSENERRAGHRCDTRPILSTVSAEATLPHSTRRDSYIGCLERDQSGA